MSSFLTFLLSLLFVYSLITDRLSAPQPASDGDIPQWKKNLLAQKNNWLAQDKHASTSDASNTGQNVNFAPVVATNAPTGHSSTFNKQTGHALHPRQIADNLLAQAFRAIKAASQADFRQAFETKSEVDFLDDLFQGSTCAFLIFLSFIPCCLGSCLRLLHWCVVYNQPAMALSLLSDGARSDIVNSKG